MKWSNPSTYDYISHDLDGPTAVQWQVVSQSQDRSTKDRTEFIERYIEIEGDPSSKES